MAGSRLHSSSTSACGTPLLPSAKRTIQSWYQRSGMSQEGNGGHRELLRGAACPSEMEHDGIGFLVLPSRVAFNME